MVKKTIGKNTLGDNNKMKVSMRNYERSTHNLSYVWRNTQAPGTLVPCMKILATPGTTYKIKINEHILTHPTVGPLFGSYKYQVDLFTVPIRLYNALLHNNALNVELEMSKVKFPKFKMLLSPESSKNPWSSSSLLAYLGWRNKGRQLGTMSTVKFNAIPAIAYYDIFKNYYANKQEKEFYVIGVDQQYMLKNPNTIDSDYNLRYGREDSDSSVLIADNTFQNKFWGSERNVYLYIKTESEIKTEDFYVEYKVNNNVAKSEIRSVLFEDGVVKGNYKRYKWKGLDDITSSQLIQIIS